MCDFWGEAPEARTPAPHHGLEQRPGTRRETLDLGALNDVEDRAHLLDGELTGGAPLGAGQGCEGRRGTKRRADQARRRALGPIEMPMTGRS